MIVEQINYFLYSFIKYLWSFYINFGNNLFKYFDV